MTRRKRRGKPTPAHRRLWGGLPKGGRGGGSPNLRAAPSPRSPAGQDWPVSLCRSVNDRRRGRFTPTVIRLPDERNQPALFLPAVLITDMVVCKKRGAVLVEPLGNDRRRRVCFLHPSRSSVAVPRQFSLSCINATSRKRTVCSDGRVHGLLQFYGANRTGRWAGRLVQVQNLPQNHISDLELARSLVRRGQFEEMYCLN